MQGNPHNVEGQPPEDAPQTTPPPTDAPEGDTNPERQGPDPGPTDAPAGDEAEQGQSGPPPESIPGDSGQAPNPKDA